MGLRPLSRLTRNLEQSTNKKKPRNLIAREIMRSEATIDKGWDYLKGDREDRMVPQLAIVVAGEVVLSKTLKHPLGW